jgi:hypothetical protein
MPPRRSTPAGKSRKAAKAGSVPDRVTVQNVNVPGYTVTVDGAKYRAMRLAMLKLLPHSAPGLTQAEIRKDLLDRVTKALFPDAGKVGWWAKMVQLDLEAKKLLTREKTSPLRWHQR